MSKRIYGDAVEIDYNNTKEFWEARSQKYNEEHPYVSVKFSDNNYEISERWDAREKGEILPKLNIDKNSFVLDIGCGIGRLSEAILPNCRYYCGMDFSESLIEIAKKRASSPTEFDFVEAPIQAINKDMPELKYIGKYNVIIIAGVFLYLNDKEIEELLEKLTEIIADNCVLYIATTIAYKERITLENWQSTEFKLDYNAVYRTTSEYMKLFSPMLEKGFSLVEEKGVFEDMGRFTETSNRYYILKR